MTWRRRSNAEAEHKAVDKYHDMIRDQMIYILDKMTKLDNERDTIRSLKLNSTIGARLRSLKKTIR